MKVFLLERPVDKARLMKVVHLMLVSVVRKKDVLTSSERSEIIKTSEEIEARTKQDEGNWRTKYIRGVPNSNWQSKND